MGEPEYRNWENSDVLDYMNKKNYFSDYENKILNDEGLNDFKNKLVDFKNIFYSEYNPNAIYAFRGADPQNLDNRENYINLNADEISRNSLQKLFKTNLENLEIIFYLEYQNINVVDGFLMDLSGSAQLSFLAVIFDKHEQAWVRQIYDCGEYDTGYYNMDDTEDYVIFDKNNYTISVEEIKKLS